MKYTFDKLKEEVNKYVDGIFIKYEHQKVEYPKAIHDTVLGTNYFEPYEVAFLDSPIVQRLRRISQTDVASFVFPSGNHNRFEHTLGVATIAGKFVDALFRRNSELFAKYKLGKDYIYQHCRVASILHDVGHGPFSHLTEQIYGSYFESIKSNMECFWGASPHEIISYLIATSERMKRFNSEIIKGVYDINIDLELVGDMIIGYSVNKPLKAFMVEIVNGAFDADKLDYMMRDSHSTGISMSLDFSRLLYTIDVVEKDEALRLSVDINGVIALEQIVFNKMTLFTTIYHHHKVRATGCLLKSIFYKNNDFEFPHNYLYYTDDDIWASGNRDNDILNSLKNRYLPKRALAISSRTIQEGIENLSKIMNLSDDERTLEDIKDAIIKTVKEVEGMDLTGKIWIDIPKAPKFKEAITCTIKNFSSAIPYLTLNDIFPIDEWVKAFSQNKWSAYVFTMPEYCEVVSKISKNVFEDLYDLKFNEYAQSICKLQNNNLP